MTEKESLEGEGFIIKDKRSSQISEDDATNIDTLEEQKNSSNEKEAERPSK